MLGTFNSNRNHLQTDLWTWIRTDIMKNIFRPFETSYEDAEPTLQHKLIYLQCSEELKSKFKQDNLCDFCKSLSSDKCLNFQQHAAV